MIFEDSINLLKGAAFSNIVINESYLFLESPAIFSEYVVPLTLLDKFDTQSAHDLYLSEVDAGKNISYYLRHTLKEDFSDYFKNLKVSVDYVDSYLVKDLTEKIEFDSKFATLEEVTEDNIDLFKSLALEVFPDWSNESDYVDYFHDLALDKSTETKTFKDFLLISDGTPVSLGSLICDTELNLAYVHNTGTAEEFRRNGYFYILNNYLANFAYDLGIDRIYSITEKDSDSYNIYKKLGFKERDIYYSFS